MHDAAVGHHCPDCVAEGRRSQRTVRTVFGGTLAGRHGQVTKSLIGINVAVAVLAVVVGGGRAVGGGGLGGLLGGTTPLHLWGALVAGAPDVSTTYVSGGQVVGSAAGVVNGEYHRLLTSMFLHYGILHLLLNMWALWVVGGVLEPLLGRVRFLVLYLVSGLGGGVAVYLTAGLDVTFLGRQLFGSLETPTAGASGAVFGLFAAFYVVLRRLRRDTSAITVLLVLNLVLTFTVPNISVAGHLGGMLTGAALAIGLAYAPREHRTAVQVATAAGVGLVLVVLTVARTAVLA
jgi:membrane associated rhomboid family serine protease